MSDVLAGVYSRSDAFKRKLIDALRNPGATVDQIKGRMVDDLRSAREQISAAADEGVNYGPASRALAERMADAYNPAGMITGDTAKILRGMSREEFLGNPKIVGMGDAKDLKPRVWSGVMDSEPVPFMNGKYELRMTPDAAAVFDRGAPIASYNGNSTLVVDPKYRRQGIGEELVYQQRTSYPTEAQADTRNKVSQHIQEKVWERIIQELRKKKD